MHPSTIATLNKLDSVEWFANVGIEDKTTDTEIVLASWNEAIKSCGSPEWEDLCLEAVNQYCERLAERSMKRFRKWNDIVDEVKKVSKPFVRRKIESIVHKHNLPKVFEDTVHWDILHLCMECEYADVYPPGFYASQSFWYFNGRFPCGWDGDFPKGKLVVY